MALINTTDPLETGREGAKRAVDQARRQVGTVPDMTARRDLERNLTKLSVRAQTASSLGAQDQAVAGIRQIENEAVHLRNTLPATTARPGKFSAKRGSGQSGGGGGSVPGPYSAKAVGARSFLFKAQGRDVVFADAMITASVAAGVTLWTASRDHKNGSDIFWGAFWLLLGGVMAVEGTGELRYGGFGVVGAMAAYLPLSLLGGTSQVL